MWLCFSHMQGDHGELGDRGGGDESLWPTFRAHQAPHPGPNFCPPRAVQPQASDKTLWASVSSVHHTHRGHRAAGTQQAPKCEDQGCPSCGCTPGDTMTSCSDHKHRTPSSRCQGEVWPCPRRMGPDIGPQSRMLVQTRVPPISRSRLASQWR